MSLQRVFSVSAVLLLAMTLYAVAPPSPDWDSVNEAIAQGLPKTAIEGLTKIADRAIEAENYAEAVKAVGLKISLEGNIQGNKPEEKITRMREAIASAPEPMKPVMEAIVANWFWHYLQQNRWRFMQRTETAAPPSDDFTTWDLPRLLQEIDRQFDKTFAYSEQLKSIPIEQYDILFTDGNAPDTYQPTLFDVLVRNALSFYSSSEHVAAKTQDAFDLSADSPIFAKLEDFLAWDPPSTDDESLTLRAIELYQQWLRFHQDDNDPSALLDADLSRLSFGYNQAFGEEKAARYKAALRRWANDHSSHETSARAMHELANVIYVEDDYVQARQVAQQGLNRFPDSVGGRRCYNLIEQIEARSAHLNTERVWSDSSSSIDIHYRNVTKVYFRLVRFDFDEFVSTGRWQPEQLNLQQRQQLLSQTAYRSWDVELPKTEDFRERVESIPVPAKVEAGPYFLIASHNADFNDADNQVSFTEIWRSDLALVLRNHQGEGYIDGFVLHATSGEPIAEASIRVWRRDQNNRWGSLPSTQTDANGLFKVRGEDFRQVLFLASHENQSLSSMNQLQIYLHQPSQPTEQTMFFTDRSLYRPGQTIHYKGICMAVDQTKDDYETIPQRELTIVFSDVNGEEIERSTQRTNDYGSFSGSVTAPRDRLMGRMTIRVDGRPSGATQVSVEEYKRPKFRVTLDPPKSAPKLADLVQLRGNATAYTGAAIDSAKVRWRVVREVQFPMWWHWRYWWMPSQSTSQEIAHGWAETSADGTFELQFTAKPDPAVSEQSEPTFLFSVYADVTDRSGETRSASTSIRVGYTALSASLSTASWLTDEQAIDISIRTTTLDGEGQQATGTLRVYQVVQPDKVAAAPLSGRPIHYGVQREPDPDPTNPNSWALGELVYEENFETNAGGMAQAAVELSSGMYRAKLESTDRFGKAVHAELPLQVLDPHAKQLNLKIPDLYAARQPSVEPGESYTAIWGSGYETARAFIEVEHRGELLQSYWTDAESTQQTITQMVNESMRGGFNVRTTMVRENRAYLHSQFVDVPWTNKQLSVRWEHMVSKLEPSAKETWTAIVSGPDAEGKVAEIVATMYDASLDAYQMHRWPNGFSVFRHDYSSVSAMFENQLKRLQNIYHGWNPSQRDGSLNYRDFPAEIAQNYGGYGFPRTYRSLGEPTEAFYAMEANDGLMMDGAGMGMDKKAMAMGGEIAASGDADREAEESTNASEDRSVDLEQVSARKNLNETAFFFPHLIATEDGTVKFEFTMPEALTEWKFIGFAHDRDLRAGSLEATTVTAKDLMVQPNPPRFLREGDEIEFTVKVSNQSPTVQTGTVRLSFADARTNDSVDARLGNADRDKPFDIPAGESESFSWRLKVPDGIDFLSYKAVGSTGRLSDGEEGYLPVLSRRVLITESMQLPIGGNQTKQFAFEKLLESGQSETLQHQSLTVQMVSNPSWYAVMALPYLMEYPYECTEQTFNRLYANELARYIAGSDPKIARVFAQWRATPALDSPLEKNEDLKSVLLEETPWYRDAKSENQARRNVGILFDQNRLNDETARNLRKLSQMQLDDGAWPWFPGGPANDYITLYITTGFGRMRHLGVDVDTSIAVKSLARLDAWATLVYNQIPVIDRKENHLSSMVALYLYGRSFFLKDLEVADEHREAVNYWLGQAKTHWLKLANRQSQAHLAVALKRFGDLDSAKPIMRSIQERSVTDEEMGMFWRDLEFSWWWYRAPIETQAMMIEAFDEVMNDQQTVEQCKVWLLKQKQTQDWKTTKATADAVYALLLRGSDLLASDAFVEVSLAGERIEPTSVEAGTGFFEHRYAAAEIEPKLGQVTVKKVDDSIAWGGIHWQYLEDISKITPHEATPLQLTKQLYVREFTEDGPKLRRVDGPIEVGDELIVRLVLRSDRDMEYLHLKDHRGSGTEPVNVLSHYKYQDGLAYYESTRDTASHFFIDYMPKGTYVFEYATRVQLRGEYQTGLANIQCMYAPEFNSHSESLAIAVK